MKINNPTLLLIGAIGLVVVGIIVLLAFTPILKKSTPPVSEVVPTTKNIEQVLPEITTIKLTKTGFDQPKIKIKSGTGITFTNESGASASVNSDDHPTHKLNKFLNLGQFESGSAVQAFFTEKGTFTYHNHLKPEQKGTVVVE